MKPRRGDDLAAAVLALQPLIRMVLRRNGVTDEDEAGDVASDVVWNVYVAARHRPPENPHALRSLAWVIARRVASKWWETRAKLVRRAGETVVPSGEGEVEAREMLAKLREATTPERWRVAVAVGAGEDMAEIAAREGIPINTAANRLRLARRDFARVLARERAKGR